MPNICELQPISPDIKKRKSFRKYLKRSPDIQRSLRYKKKLTQNNENESELLALHPMMTTGDDTSSSAQQSNKPIFVIEDNIIQGVDDAREAQELHQKELLIREKRN